MKSENHFGSTISTEYIESDEPCVLLEARPDEIEAEDIQSIADAQTEFAVTRLGCCRRDVQVGSEVSTLLG